MTRLSV